MTDQQSAQTVENSPIINKANNKFKILFIISTILLVLILGVSIFLFLQNKKLSNNFQTITGPTQAQSSISPTKTVSPSISPSISVLPDQTLDWRTYTNRTYGYEIKYPSDLMIIERSSNEVYLSTVEDKIWDVVVSVQNTNKNLEENLKEKLDKLNKNISTYKINVSDMLVDNIITKKIIWTAEGGGDVEYLLVKDNRFYTLTFRSDLGENNLILNSFRFIPIISSNSNIPSDWKTYTSQKYGFKISYPSKINFMDSCGVGEEIGVRFCGAENDNMNPAFGIDPIIFKSTQKTIIIPLTNLSKLEVSTNNIMDDISKKLPSLGWKMINDNSLNIPNTKVISFSFIEDKTKYLEHWFFVKDKILYDINFSYVTGEGFSDTQLQNQLTDLKSIFNTLQF